MCIRDRSDNEEDKKTEQIDSGKKNEEDLEDARNMDENVFKESNVVAEDEAELEFKVINPQTKSSHISYTCKGTDSQGNWEGERRYSEFHKMHEKLEQRWPGIPIPQLPPKKAIGNKEVKFINERRFYLERWPKKLAAFPFILNSKEFQCFSRP